MLVVAWNDAASLVSVVSCDCLLDLHMLTLLNNELLHVIALAEAMPLRLPINNWPLFKQSFNIFPLA